VGKDMSTKTYHAQITCIYDLKKPLRSHVMDYLLAEIALGNIDVFDEDICSIKYKLKKVNAYIDSISTIDGYTDYTFECILDVDFSVHTSILDFNKMGPYAIHEYMISKLIYKTKNKIIRNIQTRYYKHVYGLDKVIVMQYRDTSRNAFDLETGIEKPKFIFQTTLGEYLKTITI
jgi:hypothetical protein